jgi:hypothetical protein
MHGPQAFVNTFASNFLKISKNPSLSAVYRTCSDPGLIPKKALVDKFLCNA